MHSSLVVAPLHSLALSGQERGHAIAASCSWPHRQACVLPACLHGVAAAALMLADIAAQYVHGSPTLWDRLQHLLQRRRSEAAPSNPPTD